MTTALSTTYPLPPAAMSPPAGTARIAGTRPGVSSIYDPPPPGVPCRHCSASVVSILAGAGIRDAATAATGPPPALPGIPLAPALRRIWLPPFRRRNCLECHPRPLDAGAIL